MKTIKCSKCGKDVLVEDGYFNKCCPICLEKRKAEYAVESAQKQYDRESETLIKGMGIEKTPFHLEHYSNFCEWWESRGMPKPSFEIYRKELTVFRLNEIHKKADSQTKQIKGKMEEKKGYYSRFLRFDLFGFSHRERCATYRFSTMDERIDRLLFAHLQECENCQEWQYNFTERDGSGNRLLVDIDGNSLVTEPQENTKTFEEWEDEKGLKEIPVELMKHLSSEYGKQEAQTSHEDPYLDKLNREFQEEQKETEQLNKLPQHKLRRFLEQPDNT